MPTQSAKETTHQTRTSAGNLSQPTARACSTSASSAAQATACTTGSSSAPAATLDPATATS
uniref:Lpa1 n=1 Tax=Arundo donax TaxID=35708 RepID=A0A0A9GI24_ARUDO